MSATVAKKKKKPAKKKVLKIVSPHPLPFRELIKRVEKQETKASLIKTAVMEGWLTDGNFFTQLDDEETDKVKDHYDASMRRAEAVKIQLPEQVGFLVDEEKKKGHSVVLSANGISVAVDATLYLTMKRRHPSANVYLSKVSPEKNPVIFSGRNTVAMLPVIA